MNSHMTSGPIEKQDKVASPGGRRSAWLMLGVVVIACLLAGAWYVLRSPATANGVTVTASGITTNSATIAWTTDQPSTSQVEYGATPAYGLLSVFGATPVTSHSVTLTGLTPGTTYNYAALWTNPAGQVGTSANFTFTTTALAATAGSTGPPVISRVAAGGITATSATITWTTDQPFTSQVEYGITTAYGSLSAFSSVPVTSHSVILTALTPGTTYNYAALSTNATGQSTASTNFTFTTTVSGSPVIGSVKAGALTTTSATVTWTTDQPSASQVEFGTTPAHGSLSAFSAALTTSHSVILTGLTAGTTYDYAALSANSTGQVGKSENFTFTTASVAGSTAITGVTAGGITTNSATIRWTTDQPSTSQVEYGTTPAHGFLSAFSSQLATSHAVILTGLSPGTAYDYAALSTNPGGQVGKSASLTFSTAAAVPVISGITSVNITATSATIAWTTDQPSTSQVKYGATTPLWALLHRRRRYDSLSTLNSTLVTAHSVTLTGLTPDTTYNYVALSTNSSGMPNQSPNLTFATVAGRASIEIVKPASEAARETALPDLLKANFEYAVEKLALRSGITLFGVPLMEPDTERKFHGEIRSTLAETRVPGRKI